MHNTLSEGPGMAVLVAEFDGGSYELISIVATQAEAGEIAGFDMDRRMRQLNADGEPASPAAYKLWSRGANGAFQVAAEIEP